MGSWPFVPACSVRPAIAKARTSRAASARRHVARRCPSANLAHAHHGIPVSPPFPPHKVRRTTGGNASRHGRVTVSAVRACVASCAWPQDRCRAPVRRGLTAERAGDACRGAHWTPSAFLSSAHLPLPLSSVTQFRCVWFAMRLCAVKALAASILLAPPSGHLNPTLSLALPWAERARHCPKAAPRGLALAPRDRRRVVPARRCDRVGPRRHACACPKLAGQQRSHRRLARASRGGGLRRCTGGRTAVVGAACEGRADNTTPAACARARRRGGRAMGTSDAAEGARWHLRPAAALARAACGHDAAKHGQPRYGERDHRTPASACEKALWQLAKASPNA
ncbi:hypothetical protein ERJ75_001774100 [Trypanosoma vivax]|nr:hypothetical protein ERJ75_001774100 [Trypanosoma vivax]